MDFIYCQKCAASSRPENDLYYSYYNQFNTAAGGFSIPQKIVVVGDIMIDINYIATHSPKRRAPESHHIDIYEIDETTYNLGGCANVAMGLNQLKCDVFLIGVVGDDFHGNQIAQMMKTHDIHSKIYIDPTRVTTQKHRNFLNNEMLARFDIEKTHDICEELEQKIMKTAIEYNPDIIVFCDYDKGTITNKLCRNLIKYSNDNGIYTFVDPKIKNYRKYQGCYCFKPNLYEAIEICGSGGHNSPTEHGFPQIRELFLNLFNKIRCKNIVLTCGEIGLYVSTDGSGSAAVATATATELNIKKYSPPVVLYNSENQSNIIDVTGAGDTVLIVLVYVFLLKHDIVYAARISNIFGGESVKVRGNYIIHIDSMNKILKENPQTISSPPISPVPIKKVVFTNGCFDVLHSAHLKLLNFCRKQGDYFILALNSDKSIRKLKGEDRPIQSQEERMECLRELNIIDEIIVFDEETPMNLLEKIRPDVMVKGGDYEECEIAGREYAKRVVIFPLIEGKSTTSLINKILTKAADEY